MDEDSLAHSKWRCQYHIVFAPKYRRQVIYGKIKEDIGQILRKLCDYKDVEIIRAEACPDHIHILVTIPPKISVASFMGYLKGKSSIMIFEKYANMRYNVSSGISTIILHFSLATCSSNSTCFCSNSFSRSPVVLVTSPPSTAFIRFWSAMSTCRCSRLKTSYRTLCSFCSF